MAKLLFTIVTICFSVAVSTTASAAPSEEKSQPLRTPIMLKKIFADAEAVRTQDGDGSTDVLKLGLSKRDTSRPSKASSPVMAVATSAAALTFVVGIFLLIAWFMKRGASRGMRALPNEVFEVLGRSSLNTQQAVQLIRVGSKLLLVASSSDGAVTLTEIDDTDEVERLSGLCMTGKQTSATTEFHEAFEQLAAGSPGVEQPEKSEQPKPLNLSTSLRDSLALSDASRLAHSS